MGVFQVSSNAKIATCQPFLALKSLIAEDVILRTLRDGAHLCIAIQVDVRHSHRLQHSPIIEASIGMLTRFSSLKYHFCCGHHFRTSYTNRFALHRIGNIYRSVVRHSHLFKPSNPFQHSKRCADSRSRDAVKLESIILSLPLNAQ